MPVSPGPDPSARDEVAPPPVTRKPIQRTGYAVLAASGLVLATAFGGIAELVTQSDADSAGRMAAHHSSGSPEGGPGASGSSDNGNRTRTIDGVAVAETLPGAPTDTSSSGSPTPTTVVTTGQDGEPTTTTITPSAPPAHSGRDDETNPGTDESENGSSTPGDGDSGGDGSSESSSSTSSSSTSSSTSSSGPPSPTSSSSSTTSGGDGNQSDDSPTSP